MTLNRTNYPQKESNTKKEVVYDETTLELMRVAAASQLDFLYAPVNYDELKKPMNMVTARNGVFQVHKTPVAIFVHCKTTFPKDQQLVHLPEMKEEVILLADKVPFRYLIEVLSFYRDVHKKDKTEAATLIFWNENDVQLPTHYPDQPSKPIKGLTQEGRLIIYCPEQLNTSGDTNFQQDTFVTWLRENTARYIELHSHHTMNAFWSGTDNKNENATQFYGVWGNIFNDQPSFLFRYVNGKDRKIDIDASLVFDYPKVEIETEVRQKQKATLHDPDGIIGDLIAPESEGIVETKKETILFMGPYQDRPYPADWMEQHKVNRPTSFQGDNRTWGRQGSYYDPYFDGFDGYDPRFDDFSKDAALKHSFGKKKRTAKKTDSAQVALPNNLDRASAEIPDIILEEGEAAELLNRIQTIESYDYSGNVQVLDLGVSVGNEGATLDAASLALHLAATVRKLDQTGITQLVNYLDTLNDEEFELAIDQI